MRRSALIEALAASGIVTLAVTLASMFLPDKYVAVAVAFVFLAATWVLVWRKDDSLVERFGLALGGLVLPGALDYGRLARSIAQALAWALLFASVTFVPFFFGWQKFWHPRGPFGLHVEPMQAVNEIVGQLVIIALPEEAFYRGYLQSRLEDVMPSRWRLLGADIGPAIVVASVIFALGHLATIREPARLAVFFPSLAFGYLRSRTKGIGAGIVFHAACNLFSETLGRGYRLY